jgi:hypothetical protein
MGSFRNGALTPEGARLQEALRRLFGRPARWKGASKTTVYWKWVAVEGDDETIQVVLDWLSENGYPSPEVSLMRSDKHDKDGPHARFKLTFPG